MNSMNISRNFEKQKKKQKKGSALEKRILRLSNFFPLYKTPILLIFHFQGLTPHFFLSNQRKFHLYPLFSVTIQHNYLPFFEKSS